MEELRSHAGFSTTDFIFLSSHLLYRPYILHLFRI
ncbi:hypothetical protein HCH_01364 [Hahella chejuensis KCTC 2396]|uniref:Uncharacterized protein n=1 Tax=Hahella chejuensis (strain KCTC 2396) TaxID=349521 RepID=Q2SM96_HAHCH|nr:hypothetical protein HCH_01364 [Hahella chejuensis KCTC 2396]